MSRGGEGREGRGGAHTLAPRKISTGSTHTLVGPPIVLNVLWALNCVNSCPTAGQCDSSFAPTPNGRQ